MTTKPNASRRLWPYLAVPGLAVLVAATIYIADFSADDAGTGGSSNDALPGSQAEEDELTSSPVKPDPAEQQAAAQNQLQQALNTAVEDYLAGIEDENLYVSVAVADGDFAIDYEGNEQHDTASIIKVEILSMLLSDYETAADVPGWALDDAAKMIKKSDNDATNSILFGMLDGHAAMREAHPYFGLVGTEPHESERWGLTQTTAVDQLTMLEVALLEEGLLSADKQAVARELMGDLADFQQWGVSAAAAEDETVWMKNGWDTRDDLGGEWVVNSIGVIGGDTEEPISIAILTGGSASEETGIALVEDLAAVAREVIDTDPFA